MAEAGGNASAGVAEVYQAPFELTPVPSDTAAPPLTKSHAKLGVKFERTRKYVFGGRVGADGKAMVTGVGVGDDTDTSAVAGDPLALCTATEAVTAGVAAIRGSDVVYLDGLGTTHM